MNDEDMNKLLAYLLQMEMHISDVEMPLPRESLAELTQKCLRIVTNSQSKLN